jgi:predicted RNA-binding Zn-ribbon protein involved in translation (DUF1610 family)
MKLRNAFLRLLPGSVAASMEAESRDWLFDCTACGTRSSIWDVGGLRWKARGRPWRWIRCPACGRRELVRLHRRRTPDPPPG